MSKLAKTSKSYKASLNIANYFAGIASTVGNSHYGTRGSSYTAGRPAMYRFKQGDYNKGWLALLCTMVLKEAKNYAHTWGDIVLDTSVEYVDHCNNVSALYANNLNSNKMPECNCYYKRFNTPEKVANNYLNTIRGAMLDAKLITKLRKGRKFYYTTTELGTKLALEAINCSKI